MHKNKPLSFANLIIPIVAGIFLRVYMLGDQIIIDDEWHGIGVASWRSYKDILTTFWYGASSIPYDLYLKFILNTFGWNELLVRLPSIITGILSLLLFPISVNRVFDRRITIIFSLLLSISPILIFYSRFSRGYSGAVFLAFLAVFSLYSWLTTGKRFYQLCYIIAAPFALYFHLFCAFAVIAPICMVIAIKLTESIPAISNKKLAILPSLFELIATACITISCTFILLLPAYINSASTYKLHVSTGYFSWSGFAGFLHLFSGTSNQTLTILFYFFLITGSYTLIKANRLFGIIFLSIPIAYFFSFLILRPDTMQISKVMARYSIAFLPFALIAISTGMNKLFNSVTLMLKNKKSDMNLLFYSFAYIFTGLLLITGPLPVTYTIPNNFTNHSAYQESYSHKEDNKPYVSEMYHVFRVTSETVPLFYKAIENEKDKYRIIEYPMPIPDSWNIQYYYQKFHKKRIISGYFWNPPLPLKENLMYSDDIYDTTLYHMGFFLNTVNHDKKLRFKNMINMKNIAAIRQSGAKYIILHKNIIAEALQYGYLGTTKDVAYLSNYYYTCLGSPIVNDKWLIVFENAGPDMVR